MNGSWHDELEAAATVEEAVASVRRYLGSVACEDLGTLSRHCAAKRIRGDEDIDDLTFKLAQARATPSDSRNERLLGEVFELVLHASLRISQLHRRRARGQVALVWRPQMSQMG